MPRSFGTTRQSTHVMLRQQLLCLQSKHLAQERTRAIFHTRKIYQLKYSNDNKKVDVEGVHKAMKNWVKTFFYRKETTVFFIYVCYVRGPNAKNGKIIPR